MSEEGQRSVVQSQTGVEGGVYKVNTFNVCHKLNRGTDAEYEQISFSVLSVVIQIWSVGFRIKFPEDERAKNRKYIFLRCL